MHTTTPRLANATARSRRAFTLVEILISTALSSVVLMGVITSVILFTKHGYLLNNYTEMESEARNALESLALDARMAKNVSWGRASDTDPLTSLMLTTPDNVSVTYTYNSTAGTLTRQQTAPTTGTASVIISGIESLTFTAYKIDKLAITPSGKTLATINKETKQIQLSLKSRRTRTTLSDSTNSVISARFVLRNKSVSA